MSIFSLFTLLGGLALFLYGMRVMSQGLEKIAGGRFESVLKTMTENKMRALGLGMGTTALVQSSSAVTVMLVGLVNSGIMTLKQSAGVIMGADIGTTATAWLLSLIGIESSNIFVQMLKPSSFSPVVAIVGVIMLMTAKSKRKRDIGTILIGFVLLMFGMEMMSESMKPLADIPEFTNILIAFENPILGVLTGLLLTAVIQSSSASVGILQALSLTNGITYQVAIPVIMGQNVGTCITAIISSFGVNKQAKRVAAFHVTVKIIGVIIFMIAMYGASRLISFTFMDELISPVGIAIVHSVFNLFIVSVLLPFSDKLVELVTKIIPDDEKADEFEFLDQRLLYTPSVALAECGDKTKDMAELTMNNALSAISLFEEYGEARYIDLFKTEKQVDVFEDNIGEYLIKISSGNVSDRDSAEISRQLHAVSNLEKLSDHAIRLAHIAKEINTTSKHFSDAAMKEFSVLSGALKEILLLTGEAYKHSDLELAARSKPLEQVINNLIEQIRDNHVGRLKSKVSTIEDEFKIIDIVTSYDRISSHCVNITEALIDSANASDSYEYRSKIKSEGDENYKDVYLEFSEKYKII